MSDDATPGSAPPMRIMHRERPSQTVTTSAYAIVGLVVIALAAILTHQADGATLGAIVAGISGCVGYVAGRTSARNSAMGGPS